MDSERLTLEPQGCPEGQDFPALREAIQTLMAKAGSALCTGDLGLVVAAMEFNDPTGTTRRQKQALEAQGFTCATVEAWSLKEDRHVTLLLAGFPAGVAYSHTLRLTFAGPNGWFSLGNLDNELVHLLRRLWGIVPTGEI